MQVSRVTPDGWRRAGAIGDGPWSTLSPTWAWTCTKIRSRSRLQRREVREHGKIANTPTALKGLVSRLTRSGATLQFCYEAGPCGYRIQQQLTAAGHGCVVVAPSLIPRKPGDRIKTDRRDATNLAKLHRAGELTPVWVP